LRARGWLTNGVLRNAYLRGANLENAPIISAMPDNQAEVTLAQGETTFIYRCALPLVFRPDNFEMDEPIWVSSDSIHLTEVALFRRTFLLSEALEDVELHVFADTRYQVWLDGMWIGRGPARFAREYREYDVYDLEPLSPGVHVLAVLVHWSPDDRRSESIRPLLQGHLQGYQASLGQLIIRTDSAWKAILSPAWRTDAAPIHAWNLIGYTEILDFNQLPVDWFQPGFPDGAWSPAIVVDHYQTCFNPAHQISGDSAESAQQTYASSTETIDGIVYNPRSIAMTVSEPVTATVLDAGILSPGRALGEYPGGTPGPETIIFQADADTPFVIETLGEPGAPPHSLILLDGAALPWLSAGLTRPDVYTAPVNLSAGQHELVFYPPTEGLTFELTTNSLSNLEIPFAQGNHAGRRILLAEPVSQPEAVQLSGDNQLNLTFTTLPAYVVLDLGRVTLGRLEAQVSGPAGTVIDIGWDERLLEGTLRPLPYPGSLNPTWNQVDSWVLDGTPRQITTLDARTGRYILVNVWGTGPVSIENLTVYSEHYPLIQIGEFHSSNPLLDQIWQTGVDTVLLNSTDAYADPWRERGQWWGDSYIDDQVNQVAFGNFDLLRRGLLFMQSAFSESQAPACAPHNNGLHMLDYAMLWVHSLSDYLRRAGEPAILQETYTTLVSFMNHLAAFQNPATGLLDLPEAHWSQTAYIEPMGYHSRYGQSAALNAFYYATLQRAAELAGGLGDLAHQDLWSRQAVQVRESLNNLLYLPGEGRYLTHIYQGVPYPPTPQAQAWTLAYDIVPEDQQDRVANALLELLSSNPASPNVEIYGFYWILQGLGNTGHTTEAIELILNYYGHMLDQGATTWWEHFNANTSYFSALSHGWGSSPTWFLTRYVLGADQVGPNQWRIQPSFSGVETAAGSLPLPQGLLQVSWRIQECPGDGNRYAEVVIAAPADTHGELVLPGWSVQSAIVLDGQITQALGISPEGVVIRLDEGVHTATLGTACVDRP
jgi:alpha-L-rhamnosidase